MTLGPDVRPSTGSGDVVQSLAEGGPYIANYIGNGSVGCCLDHVGLMNDLRLPGVLELVGETYLNSQWHFVHGAFGMDYRLPVARLEGCLRLEGDPDPVIGLRPECLRDHRQRLDLGRGVLETTYVFAPGGSPAAVVRSSAYCSQQRKSLLAIRLEIESLSDRVTFGFGLSPVADCDYHYGGHFACRAPWESDGRLAQCALETNLQTTVVSVLADGLSLPAGRGSGDLGGSVPLTGRTSLTFLVSVDSSAEGLDPHQAGGRRLREAAELGWEALLRDHRGWWGRFWSESYADIPDERCGRIWTRGQYYLASSLSDRPAHPPLVFGLARVGWPSYFPQDFLFLYENTAVLNHRAHAASTAGYWLGILDHCREYAGRAFDLPGAVYPWTPPVLRWDDYHASGPPNHCYWQLHNSAYVAKMVHLYASFFGDEVSARAMAYPVIREIAAAYRAMLSRDPVDGRYGIRFSPLRSQDEYLDEDVPNAFDTLLSAQYGLGLANRYAEHLGCDGQLRSDWERVLAAGMAYPEAGGRWAVFEGDRRGLGSQKHTVQLNPLGVLPADGMIDNELTLASWRMRYELIAPVEEGAVAWTLGQFALASAMAGSGDDVLGDLDAIETAGLVDQRWIQCFESTGRKPHFVTTYGLLLQAVSACLLQWQRGYIHPLAAVPTAWGGRRLAFGGWRAPGGFVVCGESDSGGGCVRVTSEQGECLRLRVPDDWDGACLEEDGAPLGHPEPGYVLEVETTPGSVYTVEGRRRA